MRMPGRTGKVRFRTLTECEFKLTLCFSPAIIPRCFCGEHADNTHRVVCWVVERGIGGLQHTEHCTSTLYCSVEDNRVGWSTVSRHVEDIMAVVGVDDSLMSCRGHNGCGPPSYAEKQRSSAVCGEPKKKYPHAPPNNLCNSYSYSRCVAKRRFGAH